MQRSLESRTQRLDHLLARLNAQRPQARLARADERLQMLRQRLQRYLGDKRERDSSRLANARSRLLAQHPLALLGRAGERAETARERLRRSLHVDIERRSARLGELARTLHAVSPLATLDRGYAILLAADGGVVRSVTQAPPGAALRARVADGVLDLRVDGT
jgi:exodeoxyribonuclease VII large subunit